MIISSLAPGGGGDGGKQKSKSTTKARLMASVVWINSDFGLLLSA